MKFPIGVQSFKKLINNGFVYVDKTDLVYSLVDEGAVYFLGRPRRFGKSLLVSTLESYFLGEKELFAGLKIESLEKAWTKYPVFHIDFGNGDSFSEKNALRNSVEEYVSTWEKMYNVEPNVKLGLGRRFSKVLKAAHEQTKQPCVVLVDEYDKPLLDVIGLPDMVERNNVKVSLEEYNREFLRAFYSSLKAADEDLRFVFLTGITKFPQVSIFSGLNQLIDISMESQYEAICGITDEEVETYFHKQIEDMAKGCGCSYQEMRESLRKQYDGYHFSRKMADVYNPFSLLNALRKNELGDYWFSTGTPSLLDRMLAAGSHDIDKLIENIYTSDQFREYRADNQQLLPLIYQSGYLTIKEFFPTTSSFRLDYPNNEVKQAANKLFAQ